MLLICNPEVQTSSVNHCRMIAASSSCLNIHVPLLRRVTTKEATLCYVLPWDAITVATFNVDA